MTATAQISPEQRAVMATDDNGPHIKNIVVAFTIIAFVSVCLRIFTRLRYQAVGWEDYAIVIAMILSIVTCVFQVLQVYAGNGKHAIFVPLPDVELFLEDLFWSIIAYNTALAFTKVSIILQYRRIFTLRKMRLALDVALGICVAWGIATFFTSVFTCVPVDAYWKIAKKETAQCIKDEILWFVNAGINIFTDIMVAVLPVKAIWALQIPNRQKFAVLGILTIGWFVCVVSILRLHALIVVFQHPEDRTYYSAAAAYWSSIEMNLGIVCASLPALKPLVVTIIPNFANRHGSRGSGTPRASRISRIVAGGFGSKATRDTQDDDVELAANRIHITGPTSKLYQTNLGNNIYVKQELVQNYENPGHSSDGESQKELVNDPTQ
ncbi:hypothetical protein GQ44DRAFT_719994 [Phaeosphaeriaceae sp. PMI808]|nr:hypothetical protein GQ44DRAFT_719994 [Phaeosphaeriaceae sp. PMI808]